MLLLSLCQSTWAVGPPSLQTARNPKTLPQTPVDYSPRIAIIIDDLGYSLDKAIWATALPGAVTLSILPHSPYSRRAAELAGKHDKEVMLHAPMSSVDGKTLDPGGLTVDMSREHFLATLAANLDDFPNIRGVNNHMGSQLTQHSKPMRWLMQELRARNLYFVDSRTIASSLAWETALDYGVSTARRDIFLDNESNYLAIAEQFGQLLSLARRHGQALAIAHPYPETLRFLETALPMLEQANIRLVPVSDLLSANPTISTSSQTTKRQVDNPREVVGLINYLSE